MIGAAPGSEDEIIASTLPVAMNADAIGNITRALTKASLEKLPILWVVGRIYETIAIGAVIIQIIMIISRTSRVMNATTNASNKLRIKAIIPGTPKMNMAPVIPAPATPAAIMSVAIPVAPPGDTPAS